MFETCPGMCKLGLLEGEDGLEVVVHHKHQGGPNGAQNVGTGALEESRLSLLLHDLPEAVQCSLVVCVFCRPATIVDEENQ